MEKNLLPDIIDVNELMEVKGGKSGVDISSITCLFTAAVKCTVAGSGVVVTKPEEPKPVEPTIQDKPVAPII